METVKIVGHGPNKVVALHGWFGHAGGWGPLVDVLDTGLFTYAFLDYRGYGTRKDIAGQFTVDEIAADTLELADTLGWERFGLVGHSMGGMAIQRVLSLAPGRVSRMVGLNPIPASGYPFDEGSWAFFSSAAQSPEARFGILDLTTGKRLTRTWLNQVLRSSEENSTREAFAAYLLAWGRSNFQKEIEGNPVPFHNIIGEHDPAVSADFVRQRILPSYPNSTLEIMTNAGHYPMFETPVALATAIERALMG